MENFEGQEFRIMLEGITDDANMISQNNEGLNITSED